MFFEIELRAECVRMQGISSTATGTGTGAEAGASGEQTKAAGGGACTDEERLPATMSLRLMVTRETTSGALLSLRILLGARLGEGGDAKKALSFQHGMDQVLYQVRV